MQCLRYIDFLSNVLCNDKFSTPQSSLMVWEKQAGKFDFKLFDWVQIQLVWFYQNQESLQIRLSFMEGKQLGIIYHVFES